MRELEDILLDTIIEEYPVNVKVSFERTFHISEADPEKLIDYILEGYPIEEAIIQSDIYLDNVYCYDFKSEVL